MDSMQHPKPAARKLASKLLVVQIIFLLVALGSIGLTLFVSWKLEGSAAAINDAGSLRMRAWRLAYLASETQTLRAAGGDEIARSIAAFDVVLATLRQGDPVRPLALPRSTAVEERFATVDRDWAALARTLQAVADGGAAPPRTDIEHFVAGVNALVATIENDIAGTTAVLRNAQLALVALAIGGTVAIMYLSFMLVIRPLTRLHHGIERMAQGDLSARVPVESRDEFGELTAGFNDMAERLSGLYQTLESRVEEKTRRLAERNARLGTLYDMAAFLNRAQPQGEMCEGFLERVAAVFGAAGAAVRISGPDGQLHLFTTRDLPAAFVESERCLEAAACACGSAATGSRTVVHVVGRDAALPVALPHCREAGFMSVIAVPIEAHGEVLGIFNLFLREARLVSVDERHLLDTLGQHLGAAVENARLASLEREMAVSEERNLLAQELHDSIAQSLAFLNLQVQMLGTAMKSGDAERSRETLGEIREGVQECYADVRELLTHFRMRLSPADLQHALASMLAKFERRTGIVTALHANGSGVPLAPDRQLQVLHIVQEALSNARKHAQCERVDVTLDAGREYQIAIRDDGRGFDPAEAARLEDHVGLRIMRERATRAGGAVRVHSRPGHGTEVTLSVPAAERQAA
jgi:two-component system nitrate/nitrite sensor histidine kinase NarX